MMVLRNTKICKVMSKENVKMGGNEEMMEHEDKMDVGEVVQIIGAGVGVVMSVAERIAKMKGNKKNLEECIAAIDERIDNEIALMHEELDATRKEVEMLKKILLAMSIALGVAIVAIIVSFVI